MNNYIYITDLFGNTLSTFGGEAFIPDGAFGSIEGNTLSSVGGESTSPEGSTGASTNININELEFILININNEVLEKYLINLDSSDLDSIWDVNNAKMCEYFNTLNLDYSNYCILGHMWFPMNICSLKNKKKI